MESHDVEHTIATAALYGALAYFFYHLYTETKKARHSAQTYQHPIAVTGVRG